MDTAVRALPENLSVAEGARRLLAAKHPALPVIGADGKLTGIVTVQHLAAVLNDDDERDRIPLSDVAEMPATVQPDATVQSVLEAVLDSSSNAGLPVIDCTGSLCGWLDQEAVLRILSRRAAPPAHPGRPSPGPPQPGVPSPGLQRGPRHPGPATTASTTATEKT